MTYGTVCDVAEPDRLPALQCRVDDRPMEAVAAGFGVNESGGVIGDRSVEYCRTNYVGVSVPSALATSLGSALLFLSRIRIRRFDE